MRFVLPVAIFLLTLHPALASEDARMQVVINDFQNTSDANRKIRGYRYAEKWQLYNPQIFQNISNDYDTFAEQIHNNEYALDLLSAAAKTLSLARTPEELSLAKKFTKIEHKKLSKKAAKAYKKATQRDARRTPIKEILKNIPSSAVAARIYAAMTVADYESLREEGQQQLYTARVVKNKRIKDLSKYEYLDIRPESLIAGLQSQQPRSKIIAAQHIYHAGQRDEQVQKVLAAVTEKRFAEYQENPVGSVDELAWLFKALAATGDEKHLPLLASAQNVDNSKLQFHVAHSISKLPRFNAWYKQLEQAPDPEQLDDTQLSVLLMHSPFLSIQDAAILYLTSYRYAEYNYATLNPVMFNTIAEEYPFVRRNARQMRPIQRMLDELTLHPKTEYCEVLNAAATTAPSEHMRVHASSARKAMRVCG